LKFYILIGTNYYKIVVYAFKAILQAVTNHLSNNMILSQDSHFRWSHNVDTGNTVISKLLQHKNFWEVFFFPFSPQETDSRVFRSFKTVLVTWFCVFTCFPVLWEYISKLILVFVISFFLFIFCFHFNCYCFTSAIFCVCWKYSVFSFGILSRNVTPDNYVEAPINGVSVHFTSLLHLIQR